MVRDPFPANPDEDDDHHWYDDARDLPLPPCEVIETDPEIIGRLLGPDGETIAIVLDRPTIPFGFQPRDP